jgi:hypothetical protein
LFDVELNNGIFVVSNMNNIIKSEIKERLDNIATIDAKEKKNTFIKDTIARIEEYFVQD